MALKKSITLPNGATGDYVRIGAFIWDRLTKEASAHLMLYASQAHASQPGAEPLCLIAKLRLKGERFDAYLSNPILDDSAGVLSQLYLAAKTEPLIAGGGLPCPSLSLPEPVLSDALDV